MLLWFPIDVQEYELEFDMRQDQLEKHLEKICQKGCAGVRGDIKLLQQGEVLPELQELSESARQFVLNELQAIMAAYGDACPSQRGCQKQLDE